MSLFNIGYMSTTTMAIYYMQYVYGNKDMYAVLAAVVGMAQLLALVIFQSFFQADAAREVVSFGYYPCYDRLCHLLLC